MTMRLTMWRTLRKGMVVGSAGLALVVACDANIYDGPQSFSGTAFRPPSSGSTSSATGGTSSASGDPSPNYCEDRAFCNEMGCCPYGWRCLDEGCVTPGIRCGSDDDCSSGRYCDRDLVEPRCYPRPDAIVGRVCTSTADLDLSNGTATCHSVRIWLHNRGARTIPPGVEVEITQTRRRRLDAGADADAATDGGDGPDEPVGARVIDYTRDGILPGEVVQLDIPAEIEQRSTIRVRGGVGGVEFDDCRAENDTDTVYNGCSGAPK